MSPLDLPNIYVLDSQEESGYCRTNPHEKSDNPSLKVSWRWGCKLKARQMRWKIFDGALNATILIDFLRRLIKGAPKKIFLILDNLRVHHAKPVKAWLSKHHEAIEVFYLPSYSPELNPDEMANADLKQAVTKLAPARTKLQLVKATAQHLRSVQRQPDRIRSYFEHEPVRYAA
jgi:transposase